MNVNNTIYVAGHRGLVGSAIVRHLKAEGYNNLILPTRAELDLLDQRAVYDFFQSERPDYVFLAAARVGGIWANATHPADFIRENLYIEINVIDGAFRAGISKLLFLGSSCIYPKHAPQPIKEAYFLSGPLEPTNESYAIAKIAGIKLCEAYRSQFAAPYISVMPTNLYGPHDNFDLESAHVLPALLRKFHEAKESNSPTVTVWGTGRPRREFLHVDDLANACVFLMQNYDEADLINAGAGDDITITDLCDIIREVVGYEGEVVFDTDKPDGTPRKLLDSSRLRALGWEPRIELHAGIAQTYEWYRGNLAEALAP